METLFSTLGDSKSSQRRYQNHPKIEPFSGLGQNLKIVLPPRRELTFRGSSPSKITPFSDPFSMLAASRPEPLFFQLFNRKNGARGYPKPLKKPTENGDENEPLKRTIK